MGQDKALLEYHGKPQIEYAYALLQKYCIKVYLSKRTDQKAYKDLDCINDKNEFSNHGPLSGILSAMQEYPGADWLILACDLPFVTDACLQTLLNHRDPAKIATAFISTQDSLPEPLCAIWEKHAFGPVLKLFNEGIHCPRKVLIKSYTHLLKQNEPHWLDNINTPEEYDELKKANILTKSDKTAF